MMLEKLYEEKGKVGKTTIDVPNLVINCTAWTFPIPSTPAFKKKYQCIINQIVNELTYHWVAKYYVQTNKNKSQGLIKVDNETD